MKSSLTLVPIPDNAAQEQEHILPADTEISREKKPRLRLVSPEVQADLIKEALSKKPQRKTRKRSPTKAADAPTKGKSKPNKPEAAVKKPRKPYTRKPKEATNQSVDVSHLCENKLASIADLLAALNRVCEKKITELDSLLQSVVRELGDDAPLDDSIGEILSFVAPEIEALFTAEVEALLSSAPSSQPVAPQARYTYNAIGELFISEENDPFKEAEWTLFEEDFTSRWYDTKKEALHGLHDVMVNAGLNFACELKILTRVFSLGDYLFHKYAVGAVVGIYSEHQLHDDKAVCDGQTAMIHAQLIPDSLDVLQRISARHKADTAKQIKPESQLLDKSLKFFSVGCLASLAYAMVSMAIQTGFF